MKLINNYNLNGFSIPSRYFLAPINTGFTEDGQPSDKLVAFHELRSGHGIGVSYVGNVAIHQRLVTNDRTAYFKLEDFSVWSNITNKISLNGSLPGIQLGCRASQIPPMRESKSTLVSDYINAASNEFCNYNDTYLKEIINYYIDAAVISWKVGFKVIQIHAAHGYLLSLSLSKSFNKRSDKYGDRTYLLEKIIRGIKKKIPESILDVRISYYEGICDKEYEEKDKNRLIEKIAEMDIDIISISGGIYNVDKYLIYPKINDEHAIYEQIAIKFAKKYPKIHWNVAGNIYDIQKLKGRNIRNLTYSICRSLIADNCFIEKSLNYNIKAIKTCERCNRCHYYSNSEDNLSGCLFR